MQSINASRKYQWFVFALLAYALLYQLSYPIIMGDTDMWYHLNGGRYFWTNFSIPHTSFFSFIRPERDWINYFWGFQALIYAIFDVSGYYGLIILRALVFSATLLVIYSYLKKELSGRDHLFYLCLLLVLYFVLLDGRDYQVRPHMFSYFFIVFYLYVLEYRNKLLPILPLTTIVWVNLHGVEYIIGALLCGAYGLEFLYRHFYRKKAIGKQDKIHLLALLACGPAVLINPYFFNLLKAPFAIPQNLHLFIQELEPLTQLHFTQLIFTNLRLYSQTAFALLCIILLVGLLKAVVYHKMRVSHLILSLASIILLLKGSRFIWEFSLLNLPLITAVVKSFYLPEFSGNSRSRKVVRPLLFVLLAVIPIASTSHRLNENNRYPFNPAGLPEGTTEFLRQQHAQGNLLISPSYAGYSQWLLYPDLLVYMDMEFPPFNDFDFFQVVQAYSSAHGLQTLNSNYPIDFIFVSLADADKFDTKLDPQDQWAAVFFDDAQAVFANRARQQQLVSDWELKATKPSKIEPEEDKLQQQEQELVKIVQAHPQGLRANLKLYILLFKQKRYSEALELAQRFAKLHPHEANGLFMIGNIYENTGRCEQAVDVYQRALEVADAEVSTLLHKHLGSCYYVLQDFPKTYQHHRQAINPFKGNEAIEDLYQYAFAAYIVNDKQQAQKLLQMILLQANDESDQTTLQHSRDLLAQIDQEAGQPQIGILSWLSHLVGVSPEQETPP